MNEPKTCPLCGGKVTYVGITDIHCDGATACPNYRADTASTKPAMPAVKLDDFDFWPFFPSP